MPNKISVLIDVTVDKAINSLTNFRRSIADADGVVDKFKAGGKAAFDGIKANAGAMAVGAIGSVVAFSGTIIKAGAEMEAMDAKAETVFGKSLGRVQKWGDENAKAMGLTTREATTSAAAIADLLKPMGFTEEAATDNSLALLDLAGALSAWSGGQRSATEVSQIFTKAMLGEREELKSLGISISEADVQARLAEKGQKALTGAALAQAKAVATQELIYEKSTDAQKAWTDGSMDGVKGSNEAKAAVTRLGEVMNESLYPVLVKLVPVIAETAEGLTPLASGLEKVVGFSSDFGAILPGVASNSEKLTAQVRDLEDAFGEAGARDEWLGFLEKAMVGATTYEEVTAALTEAQKANVDITDKAANRAEYYQGAVEDVTDAVESATNRTAGYVDEAKRAKRTTEDLESAYKSLTDALSDEEAWIGVENAIDDYKSKIGEAGASNRDKRLALVQLKQELISYLGELEGVPAEKQTEILALIDQGAFDEAEKALGYLSRSRPVAISPTTGGQLPNVSSGVNGRRAAGGPVAAGGTYLVGEQGPELLQMGGASGNVVPNHKLGGGPVTININTSADPQSVVRAIEQARRMFGNRWLTG